MQNNNIINNWILRIGLSTRIAAALAAAVVLAGIFGCSSDSRSGSDAPRPAGVKITEAYRGDIALTIQATGTIAPQHETFLGPKVGGRIEALFVDEGDFVEKGAPLMRLEQIRFQLALEEARAAAKESNAQLKNAERTFKRTRKLFEQGVADKQLYDDTVTEVELARARAAVAAARLECAQEDFKDSVLYAPFSGFVVKRRMNTGELFAAKANEYVLHLVDTSTVKVEVHVFETKKQFVLVGKKVEVMVDAVPGAVFTGAITVVNPMIDPVSRKFLVKIEIPNPDFQLESGMFARVSIPERRSLQTLLVPAAAVTERDGRQVVFVADQDVARKRPVKTGMVTHEIVEIADGLSAGEQVIVDGLYAVKDGTPLVVER